MCDMHQASSILLLIVRFTVLLSTWALPDNNHPDLPWSPVRLAILQWDDLLAAGHVLLQPLMHLRCSQQKVGVGILHCLWHATVFAKTNCPPCVSQKHGSVVPKVDSPRCS